MQPVQPADPHRGLLGAVLEIALVKVLAFRLPVHPPGVVRFVVDEQEVAGISHLAQDFAGVGLVALDVALVHASPLLELLFALPGQRVPVAHENLPLAQLVKQGRGHDIKGFVVIALCRGIEHFQALLHRQSGHNDEHVLGKARGLVG